MKYPDDFVNKIINGDCLEVMKEISDNCISAVVTDPPYGIAFMNKEWDSVETNKHFQEFSFNWAKEVLRILKPGGHLLSFCGTRTYHRMVSGIEDAGFEIRDTITWLYGSGFPKSLNIANMLAKREGAKREGAKREGAGSKGNTFPINKSYNEYLLTEQAKQWEGWGTALKPACEFICVARKPLSEKSVAENVLKWGTGGINIDECRVGMGGDYTIHNAGSSASKVLNWNKNGQIESGKEYKITHGRFPANLILECICDEVIESPQETIKPTEVKGGIWNKSTGKPCGNTYKGGSIVHTNPDCPCYMLDKQSGKTGAFAPVKSGQKGFGGEIYGKYKQAGDDGKTFYGDGLSGASRFFYTAKASKSERNEGLDKLEIKQTGHGNLQNSKGFERFDIYNKNHHPTVKPVKLMEYLVKLVCPKNGIVLEPFLGSGTTAIACEKLNIKWIGIEREKEYCEIAQARIDKESSQVKLEI